MKTKRLAFALIAAILIAAPAHAFNWASIASRVERSIARIQSFQGEDEYACTAFSINEDKDYYLTAAHCDGERLKVDGQISWAVYYSEESDLMVLQVPGSNQVALEMADDAAKNGDPIAASGYAYGVFTPFTKTGTVAHPGLEVDGYTYLITDFSVIGGMSGGPIVNEDGKVISIVQMGDEYIGLGVTLDVIRKETEKYWED